MRIKNRDISDRLYISTVADDCSELAEKYAIGIEICEFCTAANMDTPQFEIWDAVVRDRLRKSSRQIFHAPFSEIYPSAIDPRAVGLAYDRLMQAAELAMNYNIRRMVVHGGYIPTVYYPEWFHDRSVSFWSRIARQLPDDFKIVVENVLEDTPERLLDIVLEVNDPRIGLCLDVGHANASTEVPVMDWINCMGSNIAHVHIHNNDGLHDFHRTLGDGTFDMDIAISRIMELAPEASFTIENEHAALSLKWLEDYGYIGEKQDG